MLVSVPLSCTIHYRDTDITAAAAATSTNSSSSSSGNSEASSSDSRAALRRLQGAVPAASDGSHSAWQFKMALEVGETRVFTAPLLQASHCWPVLAAMNLIVIVTAVASQDGAGCAPLNPPCHMAAVNPTVTATVTLTAAVAAAAVFVAQVLSHAMDPTSPLQPYIHTLPGACPGIPTPQVSSCWCPSAAAPCSCQQQNPAALLAAGNYPDLT